MVSAYVLFHPRAHTSTSLTFLQRGLLEVIFNLVDIKFGGRCTGLVLEWVQNNFKKKNWWF
jgi:hypothetical protein